MTKFNHYAQEINELAEEIAKSLDSFEADYGRIEARYNELSAAPAHTLEQQAQLARAKADYSAAKSQRVKLKMELPAKVSQTVQEIRAQLAADLDAAFAADPEKLDTSTLELLKSGILKPAEYRNLMDKAVANPTMVRLIGRYAGEAAKDSTLTRSDATMLNRLAHAAKRYDGSDQLQRFDQLADTLNRACKNPALFKHWDGLCGEIVKDF